MRIQPTPLRVERDRPFFMCYTHLEGVPDLGSAARLMRNPLGRSQSLSTRKGTSMPYASNQGVRIYYEVEGSGPPLVLQHGSACSSAEWREMGC